MNNNDLIKFNELIKGNIEGVILKNQFVDWMITVQGKKWLNPNVTVKEAIETLEKAGIKIAKNLKEYEKFKDISKCEIPSSSAKCSKEPKIITKEEIEFYYLTEELTQYQVCRKLHIGSAKLRGLLKEYGIVRKKLYTKHKLTLKEIDALMRENEKLKQRIIDLENRRNIA